MTDIIHSPVTVPSGIAVDTSGLFTPGAAFAIDAAAQVINAAWNLGNAKNTAFETKVAAITTAIQALFDAGTVDIAASSAAVPAIAEPVVTIPSSIDVSTITATFDTESAALISTFAGKVVSFLNDYFPNEATVYTAAETWLSGAIANGGLPAAVAAQMLTDDRDRQNAEATRAIDALTATFAARRYPLPPGALAGATLAIQQKAQDGIAESSRKLTLATIEQMRFAIEKSMGLRQVALGTTLDYVKTLVSGPDIASRLVGIGYDAQSKLISSVSSYYGARTDAAKVVASVNQFNAGATQDAAVKNQAADLTLVEDKVKALMVEVQAIAQMATSLFNNVHASAGTSYGVNGT